MNIYLDCGCLLQVDKCGRHKRLASEPVNLTQFANVTPMQMQLTIQFHTLSKKISSASLSLTISSLFLCDGYATYVSRFKNSNNNHS